MYNEIDISEVLNKYGRTHYGKGQLVFFFICVFIILTGLTLYDISPNPNVNVSQAIATIGNMPISIATGLLVTIFIISYFSVYLIIAVISIIFSAFLFIGILIINLFLLIWEKFGETKIGGRIHNGLKLLKFEYQSEFKYPILSDPILGVLFGLLLIIIILGMILSSLPSSNTSLMEQKNFLIIKGIKSKIAKENMGMPIRR